MALDFHEADTSEYLFGIDDGQYKSIEEIFLTLKKQTGVFINQYEDTKLTVPYQKRIISIIDDYINKTDLNIDKQKTIDVLEFRALLKFFSEKKYTIMIFCD